MNGTVCVSCSSKEQMLVHGQILFLTIQDIRQVTIYGSLFVCPVEKTHVIKNLLEI